MSTDTAATFPAPAEVVAVARARVQRQYRGTGTYPVTVGGYVVGTVDKIEQGETYWIAKDENDNLLGSAHRTRTEAVARLAETPGAAEAYREAARKGAFGTAIERVAKADHAARIKVALAEQAAEVDAVAVPTGDAFEVGDEVIAASCGRADNVQYIRHDVTGTVEKLMGAALAFRGADGSLYFASLRDLRLVADAAGLS